MRLSVILPVYNGMPFLTDAVSSLMNQSYQDFTVYAIDNGSTDGSREYLNSLDSEKIKYVRLKEKNLVKALNNGLELSDTPLIARMDADDISHPHRFEKLVNFLDNNPDVDIVGSNAQYINAAGNKHININLPLEHNKIIRAMRKIKNAVIHASIMFRQEIIDKYGKYDDKYFPCEDYELFLRMSDKIRFANVPDYLYQFRVRSNSIMSDNIKGSIKLYYFITNKYTSKHVEDVRKDESFENYRLNLFEKLDVVSLNIYRKGLNIYLNKNSIIGIMFFIVASLINPVRFFNAIKKRLFYRFST